MKIIIRNSKDLYAGILFIFFGVFSVAIGRNYPMGTASRMGPGYFPFILGSILALLGFIVSARALWVGSDRIKPWVFRPLILVLLAVLAFAILLQRLGLVLATIALVVISCLSGWEFRLLEVAILSLVLAALAVGIFAYGLGMPLNIWPF